MALDGGEWEILWILHSKCGQLTENMNVAIKTLKVTFMKICNVQTKMSQRVAGLRYLSPAFGYVAS
jgi:hypothetical protein